MDNEITASFKTVVTEIHPATTDELATYLHAHYKSCSICGHDKFLIHANPDGTPFKAAIYSPNQSSFVESYMTICEKCGHHNLFSTRFIDREISYQKPANEVQ